MAEALVRTKRKYAPYAFHPTNKLMYAAFKLRHFPQQVVNTADGLLRFQYGDQYLYLNRIWLLDFKR